MVTSKGGKADGLKESELYSEGSSLSETLWQTAHNLVDAHNSEIGYTLVADIVKVEVCTLCKNKGFLQCGSASTNDCDLVKGAIDGTKSKP